MPDEHPEHPLIRIRDYRFRLTPETREFAFNLLPLLRADANVRRLHITDFLIAYRDEDEEYAGIGVQFEPETDAPAGEDIRQMLSSLEDHHPLRLSPTQRALTESIRRENAPPRVDHQTLIQQAIMGQEGRARLAAAMVAPLRQRLDYQSLARQTFMIEQMPEGALPTYVPPPEHMLPSNDANPGADLQAAIGVLRDLGTAPVPGSIPILDGNIHVVSEPEYVGAFPVRTELTVMPADEQREPLGWRMRETIGIGMINPRGLGRLGMTRSGIESLEAPPWPEWAVPGIWVVNHTDGFVGRITHVYPGEIVLRSPRELSANGTPEFRHLPRSDDFTRDFEPAIDPTLKRTMWDRLG